MQAVKAIDPRWSGAKVLGALGSLQNRNAANMSAAYLMNGSRKSNSRKTEGLIITDTSVQHLRQTEQCLLISQLLLMARSLTQSRP